MGLCQRRHAGFLTARRKPTDNAFIEAFNGRLRAECLNAHCFLTLADAQEKLEAWRGYYNEVRPHGAIGNRSPISQQNPDGAPSPSSLKQAKFYFGRSEDWVQSNAAVH
jgi:transposase InsO family protein